MELGVGKSILVCKFNNYFGIKCGGDWIGCIVWYDDDVCNECFCVYKYFCDLYEDYFKFLKGCLCYVFFFKLKIIDYKGWVYGLKKVGYVIDFCYVYCLIDIIELYELYKYDIKDGIKWMKEFLNLY